MNELFIDLLLIGGAAFGVFMTPRGKYKVRAWLLFAEFCVFAGLSSLVYFMVDGVWYDSILIAGSLIFMYLFAMAGAAYLKTIMALIVLYHTLTLWVGTAYYLPIMLTLCLLQLGGALPGVIDGFKLKIRAVHGHRGRGYRVFNSMERIKGFLPWKHSRLN